MTRPTVPRPAPPKADLSGDGFRRIRKQLGFTQLQMASKLGIRREHYSDVELCRARPSPTLCILARLIGELGEDEVR